MILQEREEQLAANEASAEELRRETVAAADRAQAQRLDADRAARALQAECAKLQVRHTQGTWLDEGDCEWQSTLSE